MSAKGLQAYPHPVAPSPIMPDLGEALAAYRAATADDVEQAGDSARVATTAAKTAVLAALAALPAVDLAPVLTAINGIPRADVSLALQDYAAAKPSDVAGAQAALQNALNQAFLALESAIGTRSTPSQVAGFVNSAVAAINAQINNATLPLATAVALAAVRQALENILSSKASSLDVRNAQDSLFLTINSAVATINQHTSVATVKLDATVSSRATPANVTDAQTAVTTALTAAVGTLKANTDAATVKLDATVSSRATPANVTDAQTAVTTALTAAVATLTASLASAGVRTKQVSQFLAGFVPADHTEIAGSFNAVPAGTWLPGAALARGPQTTALTSSGGFIYALTRGQVHRFNPALNAWDPAVTLTGLAVWSQECGYACTQPDGRILFGGGYVAGAYSSSAYLYNPLTQAYTAVTSSPVAFLAGCQSILLKDGRTAVFSGSTGTPGATTGLVTNTNKIYIYDPSATVWSLLTLALSPFGASALTSVAQEIALCVLPSGKVLAASNQQANASAPAGAILDMSTGAVVATAPGGSAITPAGGQIQLVPTATGALWLQQGQVNIRQFTESSNSWGAGAAPLYQGSGTNLFSGYAKGQAYALTSATYALINGNTTSSATTSNLTIVFNGFPVIGTVYAAKN